jgi:GNAT superfamily N-acetyltransferase
VSSAAWAIRPARPDEAAALTELALRSKAHWGYSAAFMAAVRAELTQNPSDIGRHPTFVAEDRRDVGGFYTLRPRPDGELELADLFVAPEWIGRGCGRALLAHARDQARALGYRRMVVQSDPYAEGFYVRAGGRVIGSEPSGSIPGRTLPLLAFDLEAVEAGHEGAR